MSPEAHRDRIKGLIDRVPAELLGSLEETVRSVLGERRQHCGEPVKVVGGGLVEWCSVCGRQWRTL